MSVSSMCREPCRQGRFSSGKGTENPANFLTKHAKSGSEVDQALVSIGMANARDISGAVLTQSHTISRCEALFGQPQAVRSTGYTIFSALGLKVEGLARV